MRRALARTFLRLQSRLNRLSFPLIVPAFILVLPLMYAFLILNMLFLPTYLLEAVLFGLLRLPAALCCGAPWTGAPLPHIGAEARNAAHVARRTAVLDGFAKTYGLVIAHESVEHTVWIQGGKNQASKWSHKTSPVLRVRRAVGGGPHAGLLRDAAPAAAGPQPVTSV